MNRTWWIDELHYAGPEHLDEAYVEQYDRKAQVDPSDDIQALLDLGLCKESTVIEFGAGTGVFALAIADYCRLVIAVEPSPAMRQQLQRAKEERGIRNLTMVGGGFLSYQHTGAPVDFIYTRNALHHLPDFWKGLALRRMHTLLKANGLLRIRDLIYDFAPHEAEEKLEAWMAGAVEDAARGWTADELAEHVRTEYSTFSWLFDLMLERAGFDILERAYARHVYGTFTCRALPVESDIIAHMTKQTKKTNQIDLPSDVLTKARGRARVLGISLEEYMQSLVDKDVDAATTEHDPWREPVPKEVQEQWSREIAEFDEEEKTNPRPRAKTAAEFRKLLEEEVALLPDEPDELLFLDVGTHDQVYRRS